MDANLNISKACAAVGGVSALSKILGVKPPTVHQWLTGARPVPVERCAPIEVATSGVVTRRDLRPDDYWLIWPDLATPTGRKRRSAKEPAHA